LVINKPGIRKRIQMTIYGVDKFPYLFVDEYFYLTVIFINRIDNLVVFIMRCYSELLSWVLSSCYNKEAIIKT